MTTLDDSQHPAPSVGELILHRLRELHELHLRGVYPVASCELDLPTVVADHGFRGGALAGVVRFSVRDAGGVAHVLYGYEVLRVSRCIAADRFAWELLSYEAWFDRHCPPR